MATRKIITIDRDDLDFIIAKLCSLTLFNIDCLINLFDALDKLDEIHYSLEEGIIKIRFIVPRKEIEELYDGIESTLGRVEVILERLKCKTKLITTEKELVLRFKLPDD